MEAPETVGGRLILRPVSLADSADILDCIRQGGLSSTVPGSDSVTDLHKAREMVTGLIDRGVAGAELHFAVCLEGGRAIGMAALYGFDGKGCATIGYWIGADFRQKGYGAEAVRLLCKIGFGMGLARVYASSGASNAASLRLLKSLGFRQDAEKTGNGELLFHLDSGSD
jgi:RimJ/RimL family protein N-acetyltransferase